MREVDLVIARKLDSGVPLVGDVSRYIIAAGGKRLRPFLTVTCAGLFGVSNNSALMAASAIEFIHTYSLVHDDLPAMDDDDLRRGKPSCHVKYGEAVAILAGDALNTYAFEVLSNAPLSASVVVKLIRELSHNGGLNGMVLGQAIDCHFENQRLELDQVKMLHIHKTGMLIAASLKMGAIIVGRDDIAGSLYDFGIDLGLLFQIQDDIMDVTQDSVSAGKTTNNDEAKNSFVTLLGFDEAMREANILGDKLLNQMKSFDDNLYRELSPTLTKYINRHKE